ncbi:hypothetical protein HYPSUDRAFT_71559 [Hypholoma sublateritium FD-334 SS-4]|uniref:Uncharacterized protein n=1 Tax=Hypholoma sublateritium (strain FD-334 SS-4) TaxID=945553 RepID=A0A0D2NHY5_HYPSF|nr:hypothetical protein HYPSUDRAFT_71559 [Hypholoma sublateritium FD-334 SS-4]
MSTPSLVATTPPVRSTSTAAVPSSPALVITQLPPSTHRFPYSTGPSPPASSIQHCRLSPIDNDRSSSYNDDDPQYMAPSSPPRVAPDGLAYPRHLAAGGCYSCALFAASHSRSFAPMHPCTQYPRRRCSHQPTGGGWLALSENGEPTRSLGAGRTLAPGSTMLRRTRNSCQGAASR